MSPPPPQLNLDGFNMEEGPSDPIKDDDDDDVKPKKLTREEKKEEKNFVDTILYGLSAPLIFGPGGWGETYPDEMRSLGRIMRLAEAAKIHDSQMSNKFDAHAYLYSMSFLSAMGHSWTRIFFHCFREAHGSKWKILINDPECKRMRLEDDANLDPNEVEMLDRLRRWIYKNQVQAIKNH